MGCSPRIQQIVGKGKRGAAEYIKTCRSPEILNEILDRILSHEIAINDSESIDWIRWLMAGGNTPENFTAMVKEYHDASTCGLIWTAQSIAYRCRTCSLSPCMSLCADCFVNGNHDGHDYNMFRSQTGGACDCGDSLVMQSAGFCRKHGTSDDMKNALPPPDLLYIAELMAPRIFCRLILHLRNSYCSSLMNSAELHTAVDADDFLAMLCELSDMGAAMMRVLTSALTNTQVYRKLTQDWSRSNSTPACASYMVASERLYQEALKSLTIPEPPAEFKSCLGLQTDLHHKTFLEELVFWAVKYEYPQKLIDFLLIMLPDGKYKEALTEAFVLHYSRIAKVLEQAADPDALSKRVAKVNVQMFSIKELAFKMTENLSLLQVMLISLKNMMSSILVSREATASSAHSEAETFSVDCKSSIISQSRFWLLVADLTRVLLNEPIAMKFLNDESLVTMWLSFLSYFQGMNVHHRELTQHIEVEQDANSVFLAEYQNTEPLWSLLAHLKDQTRASVTRKVLDSYSIILQAWLDSVRSDEVNDQVSFHIPLHRSMAIFMSHAVNVQRIPLDEVLTRDDDMARQLLKHPLQIQATFYEIINGLWVRNGLEIKEEAMMYTQNYFCSSMVDADLYLLQILATRLPNNEFITAAIKQFRVRDWFAFEVEKETNTADSGHDSMLEGFLQFLATLCVNRINLGNTPSETIRAELVALLCVANRTHSQLVELIPERYVAGRTPEFDAVLEEVADYIPPNFQYDGSMQQGLYTPKPHVWEEFYDPVHVFLRTGVNKKDFQNTTDRFVDYLRRSKRLPCTAAPWPPFRMPASSDLYIDPRHVLNGNIFHAIIWLILYKYAHQNRVSENVLSLVVYLLEMAASVAEKETAKNVEEPVNTIDVVEQDFGTWFTSDDLSRNVRTVIRKITCTKSRTFEVNESILSLLVKCDSKLRGAETSLRPENISSAVLQDRIGEGLSFVEKVLRRIVLLGDACREEVKVCCDKLRVKAVASSSRSDVERNKRDHHEKKRKAEERQRELMETLAMQREKFAKDHESMMGDEEMDWRSSDSPEGVEAVQCEKYYCGICHKILPSTRENPMMLLTYVQATNVLGHRKAVSTDSSKEFTFAEYMRDRVSTLSEGFCDWTDSVTLEWDNGTYVQSCGHIFDHKCLIPLMKDVFSCPVCRQYANNAIAILPHDYTATEAQSQEVDDIRSDIIKYLERIQCPSNDCELFENVTNTSLQRMKNISHSNQQLGNVNGNSADLFGLASIARCNVEMDIILRGGSLVRKDQQNSYLVSKKSCILPLLRFLGSHARKLDHIPVLNAWRQLIGSPTYQKCDDGNRRKRVPILLRDPVHLLIQLLLTTHASSQKTYFQWIVKTLYNLVTLEAAVHLSYHLSEEQMNSIRCLDVDVSNNLETWCSVRVLKYTINMLESVLPVMGNATNCSEARLDVETKIRNFCLPFLRVACVLQHYLFDEQLPEVLTDGEEFGSLIKYLKLESRSSELHELNLTKSTVWQKELLNLVEIWFDELRVMATHNQSVMKSLAVSWCTSWSQPKLLQLPYQYKDMLETYLKKVCSTCQQQCERISVCLVCGALICLQEKCCERDGLYEAVRHTNTCGAGTGIYLTVASSNVVLIHGAKACIWGSVYLDAHGEEDSHLKRGRPLYLSEERYRLLEHEWLYHNFIRPDDFWTLHNNQL